MPLNVAQKYVASKKLYAVNPSQFEVIERERDVQGTLVTTWSYVLPAVWFRKRSNGRMAAFVGSIWDHSSNQAGRPEGFRWSYSDFVELVGTARYGGTPEGCVDEAGIAWWGNGAQNDAEFQQSWHPVLHEMILNRPALPAGFEGWFTLDERRY